MTKRWLVLLLLLLTACGGPRPSLESPRSVPPVITLVVATLTPLATASPLVATPTPQPLGPDLPPATYLTPAPIDPLTARPAIHVDQVGYGLTKPKIALVVNADAASVTLYDAGGRPVSGFTGLPLGEPQFDPDSGDTVRAVDFSALQTAGTYTLRTDDGTVSSYPLAVVAEPYRRLADLVLRGYYLSRCGTVIADPATGIYHAICHTEDAWLDASVDPNGAHVDATGGWHDAGDYGKYVATGAVTVGAMLTAYELWPDRFSASTDIPESGNGFADVLDEARWELEWLLKMQAPDGGIYHKLGPAQWPPNVTPDQDNAPRYIYPITTPDTGAFAAVMAQASHVWREYDPAFSQQTLAAAEAAWAFLETHEPILCEPGNDTGSGPYFDPDDGDQRLWAAAELFRTTGEERYLTYLETHLPKYSYTPYNWQDTASLAFVALTFSDTPTPLRDTARQQVIAVADAIEAAIASSPYRESLSAYYWGVNRQIAGDGLTLIYAHLLSPQQAYVDAARDLLHYAQGRNPLSKVYMTGLGTNSVRYPHHRYTSATGDVIPGLVVGGPNPHPDDPVLAALLASGDVPPAKAYADDEGSWASNEPAIDYASGYVGLEAYLAGEP
jgi:endoglucanase